MKAPPRIFVSHSSQDRDFTSRIVGDLKALGALVWVDYEQIASGNFARSINDGLGRCEYVVMIATRDSVRSSWVQQEVDAAIILKAKRRIKDIFILTCDDFSRQPLPQSWQTLPRLNILTDYTGSIRSLAKSVDLSKDETGGRLAFLSSDAFRMVAAVGIVVLAVAAIVMIGGIIKSSLPAPRSRDVTKVAGQAVAGSYLEFLTKKGRKQGELKTNPIDGTVFIWVPNGLYMAGPGKELKMGRGFWMAREVVTVGQYDAFRRAVTHTLPPSTHLGYENFPVTNISVEDARMYCEWARCTLPTLYQWEKAARGPEGRLYPWGDIFEPSYCWSSVGTATNSVTGPVEVGRYPNGRSPYGCDDMTGNVMQWVRDEDRIRRVGGAYDSTMPEDLTCIPRDEARSAQEALPDVGFRVCGPIIN